MKESISFKPIAQLQKHQTIFLVAQASFLVFGFRGAPKCRKVDGFVNRGSCSNSTHTRQGFLPRSANKGSAWYLYGPTDLNVESVRRRVAGENLRASLGRHEGFSCVSRVRSYFSFRYDMYYWLYDGFFYIGN